jgi:hypothetical protein
MARSNLPILAQGSRAALDTKLAEHDSALDALEIATKWLYAATKPTVHMEADLEGLLSLTDLVHADTITTAVARATALAAAWNAHIAGVGTVTANGEHKVADATNTLPTTPTNLATLKTWIGVVTGGATGTAAAIIGHGDETGVHFLDDTDTSGTMFTLSVDPPVTQADCNDDLNDILAAMKAHFNLGAAVLPP